MTDRRFVNQQNLNDRGALVSVDCRFCRLVQRFDKHAHVAPCGCAGPTRYVHRQCLQKWMVVKFQHVYNHPHNGDPEQFNIFCEVCQQRMEMEFVVTNKLSKYEDFIEKIIAKKILFSTLLLLATGLLVAIIILSVYASNSTVANNVPPKFIFALTVCSAAMVVVITIFLFNFMVIKSIVVEYIANNKNPMIMGLQANLDSVEDEVEGSQKDPYFGVQASKKEPEIDKSLMLQSRRDSGSAVSKTFTDLVMQKMYKHDEPSQKGKSQKQFNESKYNKFSRYSKREPVKEMKDQQVQISNLDKKHQQAQYTQVVKGDKSIQNGVNQLDQEIQISQNLKNQSIQASNFNKDVSIQPSFLPKMRRIFREDTSIAPASSVAEPNNKKSPLAPKKVDKNFISEYQQNISRPIEYKKPTPVKQEEMPSSEDSKKSEQQMVKEVAKPQKDLSPDPRLRLKTSKDPIKIKVMF